MPTALLRTGQIRPTEYAKWADAHRRFARRDQDRRIVDELLESIPIDGLQEPITLGVSDRYPDVYVADGHHRAVALMRLRIPRFPFRWYWIKNSGVHIEDDPFPYHLLEQRP
ncbi:ParB N-terminal domain-containing protein [Streptomyces sp. NBC_01102]|uniref:ParB N-terminal domain-containing protein n=1 Tax=Streptomyces sp. NBC_01102 TaxID=2903749 RepID=UPI00386D701A|nr:ParB N-terminal domain-containing protein [Streptomyces sp. NBC_01102]